jgi:hypothetical protein
MIRIDRTTSNEALDMKWILAACVVLIAGCVTVGSQVVPVGKDTYQLSMTGVGFATQANTNIKALQSANAYCDKIGKHMVPKTSGESGVYGWSPRQDNLVFMCLDGNDPRYLNAKPLVSEQR